MVILPRHRVSKWNFNMLQIWISTIQIIFKYASWYLVTTWSKGDAKWTFWQIYHSIDFWNAILKCYTYLLVQYVNTGNENFLIWVKKDQIWLCCTKISRSSFKFCVVLIDIHNILIFQSETRWRDSSTKMTNLCRSSLYCIKLSRGIEKLLCCTNRCQ